MGLSLGARKAKTIVGLDIEAATVAATEVVTNGDVRLGRSGIAQLGSGVTREGEISDPEALSATIKELFTEQKLSRNVRVGIANQRVMACLPARPAWGAGRRGRSRSTRSADAPRSMRSSDEWARR